MSRRSHIALVTLFMFLLVIPVIAIGAVKPKKITVSTDTGVIKTASVNINDTLRLIATPSPATAQTNGFVWKTSNKSIAKVSSTGVVSAFRAGKVTISATSRYGNKTGSITILVIDPRVPTQITLNYDGKVRLGKGSKLALTYSLAPKTATSPIKWSSSNKSIATVSSSGVISAKKKGKAKITAKTSTGKRTDTLTVEVPPFDIVISKIDGNYVGEQLIWSTLPKDSVGRVEYTYVIYKNSVQCFKTTTLSSTCNIYIGEVGSYYVEVFATDEAGTQVVKSSATTNAVYINPEITISDVRVEYKSDETYVYAQINVSSGKKPYQITAKFFDGNSCWATRKLTGSGIVCFRVNPSIKKVFLIRADIKDASENTDYDEYLVTV